MPEVCCYTATDGTKCTSTEDLVQLQHGLMSSTAKVCEEHEPDRCEECDGHILTVKGPLGGCYCA